MGFLIFVFLLLVGLTDGLVHGLIPRWMSDAEINELADSQFGDPSKINESRLLAGASNHCNGLSVGWVGLLWLLSYM